MNHPDIRTSFRAERHPDSTRCRELVIRRHTGGGDCGRPCTWTRVWQSPAMSAPAFVPICERCAHRERQAEVNRWLRAVGAEIIPVRDLGAALEARRRGGFAIQFATHPKSLGRELCWGQVAEIEAAAAAHLALRALGEVSP